MMWVLFVLLLACSGAVSASETALFGLGRHALVQFGASPSPMRRRVYGLMQRPRRVLMTLLITNTAVNVAIFTLSFIALESLSESRPVLAALGGVLTLLAVIAFGEIVPKAIAWSAPRRFAPLAAALISVVQVALAPVQWLMATMFVEPITRLLAPPRKFSETVTTEELRLLVEQSAREGMINLQENEMLQAVVALEDTSVREVMTPRVDIEWLDLRAPAAVSRESIMKTRRRRLPVGDGSIDEIVGVLCSRDVLLGGDVALRGLVRRMHFVPEQSNLLQLMRDFREKGVQSAIVVDEYGGTAGLVSLVDIAGRIVGELPDEDEEAAPPVMERIDENTYRTSGDLSVRVWADRFGVGGVEGHVDTLGGLILAKLGRLPRVGDSVEVSNLTLTVETMRKRRIRQVILRRRDVAGAKLESRS